MEKMNSMMKWHDILWQCAMGNYKAYSMDHNSEGPYFENKDNVESNTERCLEYLWRLPRKETMNLKVLPELCWNKGFEVERTMVGLKDKMNY